ncbi:erythromycin esterase family protein [Actinopolymorpha pittospori]|uniref:Erythromycin esterase n=1 Tax=Actinopolymorpha pittospori TaxID=648752 RepID=A0A927R8A2_9ACTN|nr:erythromycin esterase family protein [Actinopolymorpha pittospori]MBE1606482.1 erythromycin esterase [Actinopolymorpha pittospori]
MTKLSKQAVRPMRTLDPDGPLDDLEWLDDVVGKARVVALGESSHYIAENLQLRHGLTRYLVERHGFDAYAMETGFTEGWLVHNWVRTGEGSLGQAMAAGVTSLLGLWTQLRAHLQWMREHSPSVAFYGTDLGGSVVSLLPSLDAVTAYLAKADPDFELNPRLRETATAFAIPSAFSIPQGLAAYGELAPEDRDALTAGLAELSARVTSRRLDYVRRTSVDDYERTLRSLREVVTIDMGLRHLVRGEQLGMLTIRDATSTETVEWLLHRHDRIVLGAHNGHVQRSPGTLPGTPQGVPPATPMGLRLADRLGEDYVVIGVTMGSGQTLMEGPEFYEGKLFMDLEPPRPDSLDGLMAASHDGPFGVDLRRLPPEDTAKVGAVRQQRFGTQYLQLNPLGAYDAVVHLPHVRGADPDQDVIAHSHPDVRKRFL